MEDKSLLNETDGRKDKSLLNAQEVTGMSEGLRQFINAMVEEIVLEDVPFQKQKPLLKRQSETDGLDYNDLEGKLTSFIEAMRKYKKDGAQESAKKARTLAKACGFTDDYFEKMLTGVEDIRQAQIAKEAQAQVEARRKAAEEARRKEEEERKRNEEETRQRREEEYRKRKEEERKRNEAERKKAQEARLRKAEEENKRLIEQAAKEKQAAEAERKAQEARLRKAEEDAQAQKKAAEEEKKRLIEQTAKEKQAAEAERKSERLYIIISIFVGLFIISLLATSFCVSSPLETFLCIFSGVCGLIASILMFIAYRKDGDFGIVQLLFFTLFSAIVLFVGIAIS